MTDDGKTTAPGGARRPISEILVVLDDHQHTTHESEEVAHELGQLSNVGDTTLIEEVVTVSWSGVSSCDHSDRVKSEVRAALDAWAQRKIFEYRDWRYTRYGAKAGSVRCRQWQDTWTGKRSCGCSGGIPFYIEFRKP